MYGKYISYIIGHKRHPFVIALVGCNIYGIVLQMSELFIQFDMYFCFYFRCILLFLCIYIFLRIWRFTKYIDFKLSVLNITLIEILFNPLSMELMSGLALWESSRCHVWIMLAFATTLSNIPQNNSYDEFPCW